MAAMDDEMEDDCPDFNILTSTTIKGVIREIQRGLSRSRNIRIKLMINAEKYFRRIAELIQEEDGRIQSRLLEIMHDLQDLILEVTNLCISLSDVPEQICAIYESIYNTGAFLENITIGIYKQCKKRGLSFVELMKDFLNLLIKISCDNSGTWLYSVLISPIVVHVMNAFWCQEDLRTNWCYQVDDLMIPLAKSIFTCGDFYCQNYLITIFAYWARWATPGKAIPVINSVFACVEASARKELLRADESTESSVRTFLNAFNKSKGGPGTVITIQSMYMFVCNTEIRPPEHEVQQETDFWVDFSIVSGRLHTYYSIPDAAALASLSIRKDQIDSVCLNWVKSEGQDMDTQNDDGTQSTFAKDEKVIFFHIVLSVDFDVVASDIQSLAGKQYRSIYLVFRNCDFVEKLMTDMGYSFHKCGTRNCERPPALRRLLATKHKLRYKQSWCPESQVLGLDRSLNQSNNSNISFRTVEGPYDDDEVGETPITSSVNKENCIPCTNKGSRKTLNDTFGHQSINSCRSETSTSCFVSVSTNESESVQGEQDEDLSLGESLEGISNTTFNEPSLAFSTREDYDDNFEHENVFQKKSLLDTTTATNHEDPSPPSPREKYAHLHKYVTSRKRQQTPKKKKNVRVPKSSLSSCSENLQSKKGSESEQSFMDISCTTSYRKPMAHNTITEEYDENLEEEQDENVSFLQFCLNSSNTKTYEEPLPPTTGEEYVETLTVEEHGNVSPEISFLNASTATNYEDPLPLAAREKYAHLNKHVPFHKLQQTPKKKKIAHRVKTPKLRSSPQVKHAKSFLCEQYENVTPDQSLLSDFNIENYNDSLSPTTREEYDENLEDEQDDNVSLVQSLMDISTTTSNKDPSPTTTRDEYAENLEGEQDEVVSPEKSLLDITTTTNNKDPLLPAVCEKYAHLSKHVPFHNFQPTHLEKKRKKNTPGVRIPKFMLVRNSSPNTSVPLEGLVSPAVSEIGSPQHNNFNLTVGAILDDNEIEQDLSSDVELLHRTPKDVTPTPQIFTRDHEEEIFTPTSEKETFTPTPEEEIFTPTPEKETFTPTPEKETFTPTPEKETFTPTPEKETFTPTPEKETFAPSPDDNNSERACSLSPVFGFSRTLEARSSPISVTPEQQPSQKKRLTGFTTGSRISETKSPCYTNSFNEWKSKLAEKMQDRDYDPYDLWTSSEMDEFRDKLFPKVKTYSTRKGKKSILPRITGKKGYVMKMKNRNRRQSREQSHGLFENINSEEMAFRDKRPRKYSSFFKRRD